MSVIDGYTFAVNMEDRGVVTTLRQMKTAASAMKAEMRSSFETIRQGSGEFSALDFQIQQSSRMIENYRNIQKELRAELDKVAKAREKEIEQSKNNSVTDATERKYDKLVRQISNYEHKINQLNASTEIARQKINSYRVGLEQVRSATSSMDSSINAYNRLLQAQGIAAVNTKQKMSLLTNQQSLLRRQNNLEFNAAKELQTELSSLQNKYFAQSESIRRLNNQREKEARTVGTESNRYKELDKRISALKGSQNQVATQIQRTTNDLQRQSGRATQAATSLSKVSMSLRTMSTGRLGAVSRSLSLISARASQATAHTRAFASSLRGSFYGAATGIGAATVAIGYAVKKAADLQQSWVTTRNLLQTGAKSASEAAHETSRVAVMQRDATKYSKEYGFSQKEVADQYTELVKRGYSANQSIGSMKSMLEAARASGDDYADVVKNVSSTVDAFGLRTNNTAKMIERTRRVTNSMAYAADMTATDFRGMGEAMSYVSASAHQAGQSVEVTTAAVGELSNAGIEGTRAGTGMRKVLNSLLAPTKGATAALQKYGMSMDDFKTKSGALKQLPDIMRIINKHTKDLGKADKGAFFKAVFGTTGQQAAMVLSQNADALDKLVQKEEKAERNNYVNRLAEKNMQSTQMQAKILKQNLDAIAIDIGSTLLPAMNQVVKAFSKWAESSQGKNTLGEFRRGVESAGKVVARNSGNIMNFLGGFATGLMEVTKVSVGAAKIITWPFREIMKLTGHSGDISHVLGLVAGGLVGIVATLKIIHTTISGIRAISADALSIKNIMTGNAELKTTNSLYEQMIRLQQRSLEITEAQAKAQGIDTKATGESVAAQEASDVAGGIGGGRAKTAEKSVKINPYLDETRASRVKGWFANVLPSFGLIGGSKAGEKISSGILGKLKGLPRAIKGAGIFDTIMGTFTAFDMSKNIFSGLTSSKAKSRYKDAGKTVAEGVGWYLGGPFAGQMAGFGMDWAYRAVDSFKKGWNGYTRNYKPRGFIATVAWDFKDATRRYNNFIAGVERRHPVIAAIFRITRGSINTAFASVKFFIRNVHAGFKEMWDSISDLATGHMNRWKSDMSRDAHSMINGVKNDWKGFFSWFGKNRQKEALHKPTKSEDSSSSHSSVKSLGNTRYSKTDVANVKSMTAAIKSYEKALKGLKSTIRSNDPTKELRAMNKELKGASSNWSKVAKPIKKIGDAFKYLSRFTSSMAKKDAFAAMNRYLPKLDRTVKTHGKSLTKNINSLGKSLNHNKLEKPLSKLDKQIKASTTAWKKFEGPVRSLARSFKTLQSATKTLNGKNGLEASKKGFKDLDNALRKQKIGKNLRALAKDIKKSKVASELTSMNKSVRNSAKYWKQLAKPLRQSASAFKTLQKSIRNLSGKKSGFVQLTKDVHNLYRTIRKNPFGKEIASQAKIADKAMSGKKAGFVSIFNRNVRSMERALRSFRRTFDRDWRATWRGLDKPVHSGMSGAHSSLSHYLNSMQSKASDFEGAFLKGWKSWASSVVSSFKSAFSKLPGLASSAMRSIISRLNRGISGVNSVISDFGGDKKLRAISYANGTENGHPGGHMLVNDSVRPHWKELVKFPNKPWTMFDQRNVLVPNAPAGTKVINGETTHKIMSKLGVRHYAGGSLSDAEQDRIAQEFMDHPVKASKDLLLKLTNWNSNTPVVADLGKAMTIQFSRGIANVLKDLLGIIKEPINGDWTPVIKSAARLLHYHISQGQIGKLLRQIQTESGGSETVVNHWDSNAAAGHPSQGLLQFIPSTFNTWAVGKYRDINKGFDQILAAINCLNHGGEGGWGNIGNGHGWATGGIVSNHGLYEMAEGNLPEAIIPFDLNKRPRALQIMNNTLDHMEQDGGGTGNISRTDSKSDVQFKRQVVGLLGSIAGLSQKQIDAILSIDTDKNSMSRRKNRMRFYNDYGYDQHLSDAQRLV